MTQQYFLPLTFCLSSIGLLNGQNPDSDKITAPPTIDSASHRASSWSIGLDFDSRALVAGRDYDLAQQAFMPSLSYSHQSGLYAVARASFLSAAEPQYTQTTLGLGYGRTIGQYGYAALSYDHFFFHPADEGLLQNSLTAFGSVNKGKFNIAMSYTALFDPETAHQINMSIALNLQKTIARIRSDLFLTPNVSLLTGTETVPLQRFSNQLIEKGTGQRWETRVRFPKTGTRPNNEIEQTAFGPLSMTLSLPATLQFRRISVSLVANYVVPFAINSASEKPDNSLYFSTGLNWMLNQ